MQKCRIIPLALVFTLAAVTGHGAAEETHPFDVLHYNVTLTIDIGGEVISGNTILRAMSLEPDLDSMMLDLAVLTVDSVLSECTSLVFDHIDPVLTVELPRAYAAGDTFEVQVFYGGHPGHTETGDAGGFHFAGVPKHAFQVGLDLTSYPPTMAKYWIPCRDWPCDKATAEYHITVPGTANKVICNGILVGSEADTLADAVTFHWVEDFPVAPHLMTVHAGRFAEIVDSTYDWITFWVYPRQVETAAVHFENVSAMMDVLTAAFGPYPFPKCAYVAVPTADVGHQNCITHPAHAISTSHDNDWRVSDGLARQWWGACVTLGDWRDLWLTESFGRYGQPLFEEVAYGTDAYHRYMYEDLMLHTFADANPNSPIYDPLFPGGHTIYEKGTVVLHMLRFVLGDSVFFDALTCFGEDYAYGCATTADLQSTVEDVSGQDLDWFFSEWIYDCGWPEFEYSWNAVATDSGWSVSLVMDQVQTIGPVFTMPVEIGLATAAGDTVFEVWVDESHEEWILLLPDMPLSLELDPDHWVLLKALEVPYAGVRAHGEVALGVSLAARPNPSRGGVRAYYRVGTPQRISVGIYDIAGRLVARVFEGFVGTETGEVVWDGMNTYGGHASPGIYFCRILTEHGARSEQVVLLK
jgi:aminopeptidase N